MGEKAELAESVVDRDDNDRLRHQLGGVVAVALPDDESSPMDPEHHGKEMGPSRVRLDGSEDVQEEAILARARRSIGRGDLRAVRAERRGVKDTVPACVLLRGTPA